MRKIYFLLLAAAVFSLMVASVSANIYLDEDFEGGSPFANLGWPIYDGADNSIGQGFLPDISPSGVNVRAYNDEESPADGGQIDLSVVMSGTGSVVSSRRFLGSNSYQLESGQTLSSNTNIPNAGGNSWKFQQFAVSVAAEDVNQDAGTVLGRFTTPIEGTVTVELVVSDAPETVDLMASMTGTATRKIGSMYAGMGNWAVVSILVNANNSATEGPDDEYPWTAYDPFINGWKGPRSGNETLDDPTAKANAPLFARGAHFFVNSTTAATSFVAGTDLPEDWGLNTNQAGIHFEAVEGTLYLDNLHWNANIMHNGHWKITQEATARFLEFDTATTEPMGASVGDSWLLY